MSFAPESIYLVIAIVSVVAIALLIMGHKAGMKGIRSHFGPENAAAAAEERERAENALMIAVFFSVAVVVGLFVSGGGAFAASKNDVGALFVAVGTSMACLLVGAIVGFLFGVPRVIQTDGPGKPTTSLDASKGSDDVGGKPYKQQVNSNLEEISDWLTKIIVGVGLVEARKFLGLLNATAVTLSKGFESDGLGYALMWSILVFFPAAGFLGCYLLTRLFLAEAFGLADRAGDAGSTTSSLGGELLDNTALDSTTKMEADKKTRDAAKRIVEDIGVSTLKTAEDFGRWAKAQILVGQIQRAVDALGVAVEKFPDNLSLHLDYAAALFKAKGDKTSPQQLDQLRSAYRRLQPDSDAKDGQRLYKALTYALLYSENGFDDAIGYGEEYLGKNKKRPGKGIIFNLACAYGQKAANLMTRFGGQDAQANAQVKDLADKAYKIILQLKNSAEEDDTWGKWKDEIRLRLDPSDPRKAQTPDLKNEDDLVTFLEDARFREIAGLSSDGK